MRGRAGAGRARNITAACAAFAIAIFSAGVAAEAANVPLTVKSVNTPPTLDGLAERGIRVKATCERDCIVQVGVKLTPGKAAQLGLKRRSVGYGAKPAFAGREVLVVARIKPKALKALRANHGGRFKIGIKGLDCSEGCVLSK